MDEFKRYLDGAFKRIAVSTFLTTMTYTYICTTRFILLPLITDKRVHGEISKNRTAVIDAHRY